MSWIRDEWRQWGRQTTLWMLLSTVVVVVLGLSIMLAGEARLFLLKVVVAAIMAFLPGWIYLQFIRNKGVSLYDEYVLNLFRLRIDADENLPAPPEHTSYFARWKSAHDQLETTSKDNLYRRKFEGVYGRTAVSTFEKIYGRKGKLRDKTEAFSPVLFATLLLCLAWVLVLQPEPLDILDLGRESRAIELPYEALKFGFFGSYFFIVQDLLRRYYREDLKTVAYISASARIVFVVVIVTAVSQLWKGIDTDQKAVAFVLGMFPNLGVQMIKVSVERPFRGLIPNLEVPHPLSDIDGLSYWYEVRLAEEGIEDIQNLASANLVDLMLRTRVPIARLIDWIDQAHLHLHLPPTKDRRRDRDSAWTRFHAIGIRGATDLLRAWRELHEDPGFQEVLREALSATSKEAAIARVRTLILALEGEVNLTHVVAFKQQEWLRQAPRWEVGEKEGTPSLEGAVT
ncbi:MAG TPA: hypothetical protein VHI71_05760 [Actinomycetota bacterium]|nr:hypothetical protein [Actinomycetota bacterium]